MRHFERTPAGLATYFSPSFRTYGPEWIDAGEQVRILVQLCEELVDGEWEPLVVHVWRLAPPSPN
jgi:hypothetical protein